MIDLKDNPVHTLEAESLSYWNNEFGLPEYYSAFSEVADVEIRLGELMLEKEKLEREIATRNVESINQFTINRAIELHFLIEMGGKYLEQCVLVAGKIEEEMESEYSRDFSDDNLFTRDYEEN